MKEKKIKFVTSVIFSSKKYSFVQKNKTGTLVTGKEIFSYSVSMPEIKKRIKFVLSLLCDFSTEISVRFCDATEMQAQNSYFKKKDYPTDVLSFPSSQVSGYLGDILICLPVCLYQANSARHSLTQELEKILIHGIVHLKGFDHERNDSSWQVMTKLEKALLKELNKEIGRLDWCKVQ